MTEGKCLCGHWDNDHFDEVLHCSRCECSVFRQDKS